MSEAYKIIMDVEASVENFDSFNPMIQFYGDVGEDRNIMGEKIPMKFKSKWALDKMGSLGERSPAFDIVNMEREGFSTMFDVPEDEQILDKEQAMTERADGGKQVQNGKKNTGLSTGILSTAQMERVSDNHALFGGSDSEDEEEKAVKEEEDRMGEADMGDVDMEDVDMGDAM